MEGSLHGKRFPSLLSAPETFLTCSLSLLSSWWAGSQFLRKDFVYFRVGYHLGGISKVKVPESIGVTFISITYMVLVASVCVIVAFIFLLCFLSTFPSSREVNIRPAFSRRQVRSTSSRSRKLSPSPMDLFIGLSP